MGKNKEKKRKRRMAGEKSPPGDNTIGTFFAVGE